MTESTKASKLSKRQKIKYSFWSIVLLLFGWFCLYALASKLDRTVLSPAPLFNPADFGATLAYPAPSAGVTLPTSSPSTSTFDPIANGAAVAYPAPSSQNSDMTNPFGTSTVPDPSFSVPTQPNSDGTYANPFGDPTSTSGNQNQPSGPLPSWLLGDNALYSAAGSDLLVVFIFGFLAILWAFALLLRVFDSSTTYVLYRFSKTKTWWHFKNAGSELGRFLKYVIKFGFWILLFMGAIWLVLALGPLWLIVLILGAILLVLILKH